MTDNWEHSVHEQSEYGKECIFTAQGLGRKKQTVSHQHYQLAHTQSRHTWEAELQASMKEVPLKSGLKRMNSLSSLMLLSRAAFHWGEAINLTARWPFLNLIIIFLLAFSFTFTNIHTFIPLTFIHIHTHTGT